MVRSIRGFFLANRNALLQFGVQGTPSRIQFLAFRDLQQIAVGRSASNIKNRIQTSGLALDTCRQRHIKR